MFGRQFRAAKHRQHLPNPNTPGYTFERIGSIPRVAGQCSSCDGMGRETYETESGTLSTQTCTACGGTGVTASRRVANDWEAIQDKVQLSGWDPMYADYIAWALDNDKDVTDTYSIVDYSDLMGLDAEDEKLIKKFVNVTAPRLYSKRRTAFLDTVEFTEPRHRVAGWNWDDHLNGFIAAEAAREFTCACGDNIPAPGYTDCRCGKRWNTYTISANGSKKMIAREVPVRENVVMARTASSRKQVESGVPKFREGDMVIGRGPDMNTHTLREVGSVVEQDGGYFYRLRKLHGSGPGGQRLYAEEHLEGYRIQRGSCKTAADYSNYSYDQLVDARDILRQEYADWRIDQSEYRDTLAEIEAEAESRGLTLASRKGRVVARRKIAAPSSGADAIAQHFPGWRVDDDNGNFWEIHSPGGEHAFIHEENGTYTLLMDDNTPDEFYATGLSFEDALAEVRAEGII